MATTYTITADTSVCKLCPELGGSILSWQVGAQNMLRETNDSVIADSNRLGLASFPLVPYSNRIGSAHFAWGGQQIDLIKNFAPEPHAIHGTGWEDAWEAEMVGSDQIILRLSHGGDRRWPWPFDAQQIVTVSPSGLHLDLSCTNRSNATVPLAFGHHPYFDQAGASMAFNAEHIWMSGDDSLPAVVVTPEDQFAFDEKGPVEGRDIDNCYAGWSGRARIEWQGRGLALEIASPMPAAVVYIPKGGDAFCFEPVPHINNALNMPGQEPAMPLIAPNETYHTVIEFRAVAAAARIGL